MMNITKNSEETRFMIMKKKNKSHLRLSADERPLFGNYKRVHRTKKDKMNNRQNRKKALRESLNDE